MAITNYGELKTVVEEWLERPDLVSKIPDFITLAESMINRDLRCKENEKRITADINTEFVDIPTNFIEMRNFEVELSPDSNGDPAYIRKLDYMPPEQIDEFYPTMDVHAPEVYTIQGEEFQLKPVPDTTYTINMLYWYRLTALSADLSFNNVLLRYPGAYLYSALVSASPYIEDAQRIGQWAELYNSEIETINSTDKRGRFSGSTIQARPDFEE